MAFVAYSDKKILFKGHTKCAQTSLFFLLGRPWHPDEPGILGKMDLTNHVKSPEDEIRPMSYWKKVWLGYRTATFIRNPYDRVVSGYFYGKQHNSGLEDMSFEKYVMGHAEKGHGFGYLWLPKLTDFIDCEIDFVGRYETLNEDVERFCKWADVPYSPLPKKNKSAQRFHVKNGKAKKIEWQEMYNDDMLNHIHDWYKADFEMFGY